MRHACQLVSLFYRKITVAGGNHHLSQGINCQQFFSVYFKQPVYLGLQLNLSLFYLRFGHIFIFADIPQNLGALIFMEDSLCLFPDKQVLLAHR